MIEIAQKDHVLFVGISIQNSSIHVIQQHVLFTPVAYGIPEDDMDGDECEVELSCLE